MKAFEGAAVEEFEHQMVRHVAGFAPKHAEVLGETVVRAVVHDGINRAAGYGFTNRGPVRFYIELMFMFGSDFETDPQLRWTAELKNVNALGQAACADRLYERVRAFSDAVAGPNYAFEKRALDRFVTLLNARSLLLKLYSEADVLSRLRALYPEKCACIGDDALQALLLKASEIGRRRDIATAFGIAVLTGLLFAFGHGCTTDLQFSWIGASLDESTGRDPEVRAEHLLSKASAYLRAASSHFDRK